MVRNGLIVIAAVAVLTSIPAAGQIGGPLDGLDLGPFDAAGKLSAAAVAQYTQVAPGQTFHVAIDMRIADGWAYYSNEPGDNGEVTVLPATLDANVGPLKAGAVLWPPHRRHEYKLPDQTLVNYAWEGRAVAFVPVTVPNDAAAGEVRMRFRLGGQICSADKCITIGSPEPLVVSAKVAIGPEAVTNPQWGGDLDDALAIARPRQTAEALRQAPRPRADRSLLAGLGLALLAGLMFNIMPCVLPVIPLRIYSVVQMAGGTRRRFITLGLAFAGGILVFFLLVAAANIVVKLATGNALNWSEQFQVPWVRTALALFVVAVAAYFFGLVNVTVPSKVAAAEGRLTGGGGHLAAGGMGLMLAILATPCSFGFLVLALGWAQGQPLAVGTLAFAMMGVGMAAPHALLAAFPKLVDHLPKPGRWMEILKQATGFALLGVAVWLFSTLERFGWTAGYAIVLVFALWMWGSWVRYDASLKTKLVVRGLAAALAIGAGVWMLTPPSPLAVEFKDYDPARIAAATENGRVVLVKFTADTCLSCKWIDRMVYTDPEVDKRLKQMKVLAMKADTTNPGPAQSRLNELKAAVPLTVIYPPKGGQPIYLTTKYTKAELFEALTKATPGRGGG